MLTPGKLVIFLLLPNCLWFFMLPRTEWLLPASPMPGSCLNHCWKQFCCTPGDGWWAERGDQGSPNECADPGVTHVPQVVLLQCCKQKIDELYNVLLLLLIFLSAGVFSVSWGLTGPFGHKTIFTPSRQLGCWRQEMCPCSLSDKQKSEWTSGKEHAQQRFSNTAQKHGAPSTSNSCEDISLWTFKSALKAEDRLKQCHGLAFPKLISEVLDSPVQHYIAPCPLNL